MVNDVQYIERLQKQKENANSAFNKKYVENVRNIVRDTTLWSKARD